MASLNAISQMIAARDLVGASSALQKLASKKSRQQMDWSGVMRLAAGLGDQETALRAARNWAEAEPFNAHAQIALINALSAVAKHGEAARAAHRLQNDPAAAADGYFLEGVSLARVGERDKALQLFREAIALERSHAGAWEHIALLNGYEPVEADIAAMKALLARNLPAEKSTPIHYALGRAYDFAGDYRSAFEHIEKGAGLRERISSARIEPELAYLERLKETFAADLIDRLGAPGDDPHLVFILSAPRSGSTLIEQILATSPQIKPSGEHTILRLATLRLGSMEPPDMAAAESFQRSDWRKISQTYVGGLRRRFGPSTAYTDKSLGNYYYVGLIRILFPGARIILCKRDLRDVAWSCYRSRLGTISWTQHLEKCVQFLIAQDRLFEHWASVAADNLLQVNYEDLVTNPDAATERIFRHIGVDRPENWRDFHRIGDPVASASLAQVRRPLNQNAVGAWRRYAEFLALTYDKYFG